MSLSDMAARLKDDTSARSVPTRLGWPSDGALAANTGRDLLAATVPGDEARLFQAVARALPTGNRALNDADLRCLGRPFQGDPCTRTVWRPRGFLDRVMS